MAGARVRLVSPTPADRIDFLAAVAASGRLHYPWLGPMDGLWFDRFATRAASDRYDPQLLRRLENGALVGYFNISDIVAGAFRSGHLGYAAFAPHAGHGYMTEGMQLLLRRAFTELGLHRLEANIQPGNGPSIALARRAGFVLEGYSERYLKIRGRWRDHERWAIRSEQWRAGQSTPPAG